MILTLLSHQWKSFWRSRSAGKSLVTQLVIGFLMLYLLASAALLGIMLPYYLEKAFPGQNIVLIFCGFILYYFAFDILLRFSFQDLPVLSIQPYLTENIRRRQLVAFLNVRSIFHFFNLLPLLIFTPFTVQTIAKANGPLASTSFMITILALTAFNHFGVLFIKRKTIVNGWWILGFFGVVGMLGLLDYFNIISLHHASAVFFSKLLSAPWLCLIAVLAAIAAFTNNARFLRRNLYMEEMVKAGKEKQSTEYTWLQQYGLYGDLIALDIKLILRNKRPRNLLTMSAIFLLYGFILYKPQTPLHHNVLPLYLLGGLIITGMFTLNYGQFLLAWQSGYFDLLSTTRIPFRAFLQAKFRFLMTLCTVSFLLSTPYGFMDWRIIPVEAVAWLYNIGLTPVLAALFSTYNYKSIDLSKGATFNYQGLGATQWLYAFGSLLVPFAIYLPFAWLTNPWTGIIAVGLFGLINILLRSWWLKIIEAGFQKRKYLILQGFREK